MSPRRFLALSIMVTMISVVPRPAVAQTSGGKAKKRAPAKTWTVPVTADGQPDLQGVWLSNSATPLERPKALEGKAFLTDADVAELKKRAERLFKDGNSDFAAGDNAFLAAYANVDQYKNPNISVGSSIEMVEREFDNRTSLIVDPPDGKLPPMTPHAQQKLAAMDARQRLP